MAEDETGARWPELPASLAVEPEPRRIRRLFEAARLKEGGAALRRSWLQTKAPKAPSADLDWSRRIDETTVSKLLGSRKGSVKFGKLRDFVEGIEFYQGRPSDIPYGELLRVPPGAELPVSDVIEQYQSLLRVRCAHVAPLPDSALRVPLESVYMEQLLHSVGETKGEGSFEALMNSRPVSHIALLGESGIGKSTLLRFWALKLANDSGGPLAVYCSLKECAEARIHPFRLAANQLRGAAASASDERALEESLFASARKGGIWLLLDGLNDLSSSERRWLDEVFPVWRAQLMSSPLVVASRTHGHAQTHPLGESLSAFEMRRLSSEQSRELFVLYREALSESGGGTQSDGVMQIDVSRAFESAPPSAIEACAWPLGVAMFGARSQSGTVSDGMSCEDTVRALLRVEGDAPNVQRDAHRELVIELGCEFGLSLVLAQSKGPWLGRVLQNALASSSRAEEMLRRLRWSELNFLEELLAAGLIIATSPSPSEPGSAHEEWASEGSFAFRTTGLVDWMAAQALQRERLEGGPWLPHLFASAIEPPHFGAICARLCESSQKPEDVLLEIKDHDHRSYLATLGSLQLDDYSAAIRTFPSEGGGNGDDLLYIGHTWRKFSRGAKEVWEAWLWERVSRWPSSERLGHLYFVLERLGIEGDRLALRARFFEACGRPLPDEKPLGLVRCAGGEVFLGSPEGEGHRDEHPLHACQLDTFEIAQRPTSHEEYQRFDPAHAYVASEGGAAAVNVNFWEAYLYCRWLGGALPTEAQWEHAARSQGEGLALGRVWEWCRDGYHAKAYQMVTPTPGSGERYVEASRNRVLRGGSRRSLADHFRPAYRSYLEPDARTDDLGFRPVFRLRNHPIKR